MAGQLMSNSVAIMSTQIKIAPFSMQYRLQVLELLQYIWQERSEGEAIERFRWRYENNPCESIPPMHVALDQDRVVGFRAYVVQMFTRNDEKYRVLSPADAIIHPEYRRYGIFTKLNISVLEQVIHDTRHNTIILNLSSNQYSTPAYLKLGWSPADARKALLYRFSIRNAINIHGIGMRKNIPDDMPHGIDRQGGYEIMLTRSAPTKKMAAIANQFNQRGIISNVRDESYFIWRYAIEQASYVFCICSQNERDSGYAVFRRISNRRSALYEHCCESPRALKAMVTYYLQMCGDYVVTGEALSKYSSQYLKMAGFIERPQSFKAFWRKSVVMPPMLVRPAVAAPNDDDFRGFGFDLRDVSNWSLHPADAH